VNLFNQVNWYKFEINGKRTTVIATSVLHAISIIQSELGDVEYSYLGKVE
jgi:hypothetical protein